MSKSVLILHDFKLTINGALVPFEAGELLQDEVLMRAVLTAKAPVVETDDDYVVCPHCSRAFLLPDDEAEC
jgi:hypothetical protein